MLKALAEFVGTFILVFIGCGAAVFAGKEIGTFGIAVAFGLGMTAAAYAVGPVSGAHVNPAVSLASYIAGKLSRQSLMLYVTAQVLGGLVAAFFISGLASETVSGTYFATSGIAPNGWGREFGREFNGKGAFIFEMLATFIFVLVILTATQLGAPTALAGIAIGATLAGIHLVGIKLTGVSVNPARSIGPGLYSGWAAISQLWVFIAAPLLGGLLAGLLYKTGALNATH